MYQFTRSVRSALNVRAPDAPTPVHVLEVTCIEDQVSPLSDEPTVDLIQFLIDAHDDSVAPMAAKTVCRDAMCRTWFASMGAIASSDLEYAMYHLATGAGWTVDGEEWCNPATPESLCSMVGFWSAIYCDRKNAGDVDAAARALTKWAMAYVALRYASPPSIRTPVS